VERAHLRLVAALVVATTVPGSAVWASAPLLRTWTSTDLRGLVHQVSSEHGLDPRLVDCLVRVESAYNPSAVSHKGAMGLMQLMPGTASRHGVSNPFDPEDNVRGGVRELVRLLNLYAGDLPLTLAAYNAGEGAVAKYRGIPPYRETRDYVVRILSMYNGRPWSGGSTASARPPVRVVRNPAGQTVISNYARGSESGVLGGGPASGAVLGGGFGR
jgi:soluble lytic murein transglycosylase-like protein